MTPLSRLFYWTTRPAVLVAFVLLIAFCYLYVDRPLSEYLIQARLKHNFPPLNWFTRLGTGPLYFALFFLLALTFRYIWINPVWQARAWVLWLSAVIPSLICTVLKVTLGRARPMQWLDSGIYGFYGFHGLKFKAAFMSFPSGHTTVIMGVMLGFTALFPRYWWAFISTGLLVAISRVLLVQHYLSDILVASYLAVLEIGLMSQICQQKGWFMAAWPNHLPKNTAIK